ncbi:Uncharacterised protein [Mycobacteroides abscessus subsp. abscessus]|nr:Uncharacterised protein [Mycobacteroides abscessus subsp. abscessus]
MTEVAAEPAVQARFLPDFAHRGEHGGLAGVEFALRQRPILIFRPVHHRDLDRARRGAPPHHRTRGMNIGCHPGIPERPAVHRVSRALAHCWSKAHQELLVVAHLPVRGARTVRGSLPTAVGLEHPAAGGGGQRRVEDLAELLAQLRVLHLCHHLDPAVQIAVHHVGAADPVLVLRLEVHDPRVLEEPAQDRAHLDVLAHAGNAGLEAADAAHHDLHRHTGLGGTVERVDHLLVHDRVGLQPDSRRRAPLGQFDLALDAFDDARPYALRRDQQVAIVRLARVPGQRVEQVGQVGADFRCGGGSSGGWSSPRGAPPGRSCSASSTRSGRRPRARLPAPACGPT